jgi:hypothetical protein
MDPTAAPTTHALGERSDGDGGRRMLDDNNGAGPGSDLFVIAVATAAGMVAMLVMLLIYRHCLKKRDYTYTRVHHGLDAEEEEFKRSLENQSDEIDDLFNYDQESGASDGAAFDAAELEQIEMLDNYRNNLVAGTPDKELPLPRTGK